VTHKTKLLQITKHLLRTQGRDTSVPLYTTPCNRQGSQRLIGLDLFETHQTTLAEDRAPENAERTNEVVSRIPARSGPEKKSAQSGQTKIIFSLRARYLEGMDSGELTTLRCKRGDGALNEVSPRKDTRLSRAVPLQETGQYKNRRTGNEVECRVCSTES